MRTRCSDPLAPLDPAAWGERAAAHLLRRAGFGGPPAEVGELAALGLEGAVARLVDFPDEEPLLEEAIAAAGSALEVDVEGMREDGRDGLEVLRAWWIFRLAHTRHPLREKLTLFWHGHFATAASKVLRPALLVEHNRALRRLGPGPFRRLLGAVARDPSMLAYLDGRLNRAGAPNENWARELLELFTLGVGRYTQHDVSELARVFTGWTTPDPDTGPFVFDPQQHDAGDKLVFAQPLRGRRGPAGVEEGEEALDLVVARPECPHWLAGKLLACFAAPSWPVEVQDALAATLRAHGLSTREALRALFASQWFHADERRFALYRSGVEQALGAVRGLGVQNAHLLGLDRTLRRLGQDLFEPPSVAGWPGGPSWVQSGALVERFALARRLSELPHTRLTVTGSSALDLEALAPAPDADDEALADHAARSLLGEPLSGAAREVLLAYLADSGRRHAPASARDARRAKLRGLVHLLLSSPHFALA